VEGRKSPSSLGGRERGGRGALFFFPFLPVFSGIVTTRSALNRNNVEISPLPSLGWAGKVFLARKLVSL